MIFPQMQEHIRQAVPGLVEVEYDEEKNRDGAARFVARLEEQFGTSHEIMSFADAGALRQRSPIDTLREMAPHAEIIVVAPPEAE